MTSVKPVPAPRGEEASWFEAAADGRLTYQRCGACGAIPSYPRAICPTCWSADLHEEDSAGLGTIYSFTVQHRAGARGFEADVPYAIVLVDMAEGFRAMANITGCAPDSVRIGLPVEVRFDDERGLPAFVLAGIA